MRRRGREGGREGGRRVTPDPRGQTVPNVGVGVVVVSFWLFFLLLLLGIVRQAQGAVQAQAPLHKQPAHAARSAEAV